MASVSMGQDEPEIIGLFDFRKQKGEEFSDRDPLLLHRIAVAHSDRVIFERVEIDCNAERSSQFVLAAVPLADRA